ncbi:MULTISPECIES: DinB family protein [Pedobacter]|uniref:DinB family protein n=1 Tax=Pedobacter heparinus (strain ATCC 13125 / DSM 2366 / CIP 104194 / JCM 7457 / NBRC 12017 / NCIMB 9290 / NRRL B-14731 / HIM 762-3) TaxID=485917 RepID=C6XZC1_PEDHD|nr:MULTISPECIES: DinB family protein [Pedobacter]ACU04617.1 DinB family protein [Pedobacter heparinus DSM 2366]MBB5437532.1 putative damage-inducible protein DinB [Pedobacter sp. AK017]
MNNLLKFQYQLVKESRAVVLRYLELQVQDDLLKGVDTFNGKSIAFMMVHVANTYIAWVGNFALAMQRPYYTESEFTMVAQLRTIFKDVDLIMEQFITGFATDTMRAVKGYKWADQYIETDAYSIFTHVLTHEFHHKGQIMTMGRLLGHTPPDTDVMRF